MKTNLQSTLFALISSVALLSTSPPLYAETDETIVFFLGSGSPQREIYQARLGEAFKRIGLTTKMVTIPGQRALLMSNTKGDGAIRLKNIHQLAPDNSNNLVIVPEVIEERIAMVYVRKGHSFDLNGWDSLKPFANGFRRGAKIFEKKVPGKDEGKRVMLQNTQQLLKMLAAGHIDTVVEWKVLGDGNIKKMGLESEIEAIASPIMKKHLYPFLHKKHQALVEPLAKAIRSIKDDGSYKRLKAQILEAQ
jgi:polar amino acid transport system substrate-binding protein